MAAQTLRWRADHQHRSCARWVRRAHTENGQPLRFAIGGAVIYTNEAGLQFRLSITGFYRPAGPSGLYARGARYLLNSSSPWMPVSESSLRPDDSA